MLSGPKLWPNLDKDNAEDSPSAGGLKCPEIEAKPSVVWVQIKIKTFIAVKPLQTKLDKAKSHLYLLHRVNMLKAYSSSDVVHLAVHLLLLYLKYFLHKYF